MTLSVIPLQCVAQQYNWGKHGLQSTVAQLLQSNGEHIDESKPYAELWMGTHPSGPSAVKSTSTTLLSYLNSTPLPFLFKVLSINQPLSIQAHPNKTLAALLHATNPKEYKDDNHKPELACALTEFNVMCGFRPLKQILLYCDTVQELRQCMGEQYVEELKTAYEHHDESACKQALRQAYSHLMSCDTQTLQQQLNSLLTRLEKQTTLQDDCEFNNSSICNLNAFSLIRTLHSQYPYDIGIFSPFLLNCFTLNPGQSIFLPPNEPHAYLSGDCVECMACSDNVVRAGLTPKFKDVAVLCEMLTYKTELPQINEGYKLDEQTRVYQAPVPEFILYRIAVQQAQQPYHVKSLPVHSIVIVTQGSGNITVNQTKQSEPVKRGAVFLIPANQSVDLQASGDEELQVFQCTENFEYK